MPRTSLEIAAKQLNRLIFVLALLGVIVAVYVLQSFLRQSAVVCLTGGGCELVRKSPYSYPFGIPVPAFGLVGYSFLALLSFLRTLNYELSTKLLRPMLAIAIFGVAFVSWFTYMELFVIKGVCTWCAISAANMFIIFFLILYSFVLQRRHLNVKDQKSKIKYTYQK